MDFLRVEEIDFKVNLSIADILKIVDEYGQEKGEEYEVDQDGILYNPVSEVTNEPVWEVPVIEVRLKEKYKYVDDPYIFLGISDSRKKLAYVRTNLWRVAEIF